MEVSPKYGSSKIGSAIAQDYALAFLSEVNWHEIASHKAEEYDLFNDDDDNEE